MNGIYSFIQTNPIIFSNKERKKEKQYPLSQKFFMFNFWVVFIKISSLKKNLFFLCTFKMPFLKHNTTNMLLSKLVIFDVESLITELLYAKSKLEIFMI